MKLLVPMALMRPVSWVCWAEVRFVLLLMAWIAAAESEAQVEEVTSIRVLLRSLAVEVASAWRAMMKLLIVELT